jgi:hypothetical protein
VIWAEHPFVLSNHDATRTLVEKLKKPKPLFFSVSAARRRAETKSGAQRGKTVKNITVSAAKIPERCLHYCKLQG